MAAVKTHQVPQAQDRRTRMVTSSVNAPVKKGGAGGAYTWGSVMSVSDYEPVGMQGFTKVGIEAEQPDRGLVWHEVPAAPVVSTDTFPQLGATAVAAPAVTWAGVPDKVFQAPPPVPATAIAQPAVTAAPVTYQRSSASAAVPSSTPWRPAVAAPAQAMPADQWMVVTHDKHGKTILTPEALPEPEPFMGPLSTDLVRTGVQSFDGQHPRNTFARKPHVVARAPVEAPQAPPAIDWSSFGTVSLQTQMLQANTNPAHLSPYTEVKPAPDMKELKLAAAAAPSMKQHYIPKPHVQQKMVARNQMHVIQQPRK